MTLSPGDRFGSYEVIALIGAGGMGEVYRARDARLQRDVALKILPDSRRLDTVAIQRLEREARLLASVNHPNIATLSTAGGAAPRSRRGPRPGCSPPTSSDSRSSSSTPWRATADSSFAARPPKRPVLRRSRWS